MKNISLFILILLVFWLGNDNLKLRSEIKPFKTTLTQSDSIYRLECELFRKDSLMMSIEDFMKDEKDALRFKKIYFKN